MKHLNGKPLIYWTINSIKKSLTKKARVFISTDNVKKLQILVKNWV